MSGRSHGPRLAILGALAVVSSLDAQAQVGTLYGVPTFKTPLQPNGAALGDFDADGRADVATTQGQQVVILLSSGTELVQHAAYTLPPQPWGLVVADFTNDGKPDVVTSDPVAARVTTLTGLGGGDFSVGAPSAIGTNLGTPVPGDFNGDGALDLAVRFEFNPTELGIALGSGTGLFSLVNTYGLPSGDQAHTVADLDGDAFLDVAVAMYADAVLVFRGTGTGALIPHGSWPTGDLPLDVLVADMDENGFPDLVTADEHGDTVSLLSGLGDGTFPTHQSHPAGVAPLAVVAADFDEDGHADVLSADFEDGTLSLLRGDGAGQLAAADAIKSGYTPYDLVVTDWDVDGHLDVATFNRNTPFGLYTWNTTISFVMGRGDGSFRANLAFANDSPNYAVASGDLDGDGRDDIVLGLLFPKAVRVGLGLGDGSFADLGLFGSGAMVISAEAIALADLDADGDLDVAAAGGSDTEILLGSGDGSLVHVVTSDSGGDPEDIVARDFNGDGLPDLATADQASGLVSVLLGLGGGQFGAPVGVFVGDQPSSLASADFDADGDADLAVAVSDAIVSLESLGTGVLVPGLPQYTEGTARALAAGLLNADVLPDLAAVTSADQLAVLLSQPGGGFSISTSAAGNIAQALQAGDIDGDGNLDLAIGNGGDNSVGVRLGAGDGSFVDGGLYGAPSGAHRIAVGDYDSDGRPDLAVAPNHSAANEDIGILINQSASAWSKLGFALTGAHGLPALYGTGPLADGSANALHFTGLNPVELAVLIVGPSQAPLPFKGGTLVPAPALLIALVSAPNGTLELPFPMPAGLPTGLTLVMQTWFKDAAGLHGFASTNALVGTLP